MLMVGGWCVCGVREGSTALLLLQFSFISDILGIVVLVQMLNVFFSPILDVFHEGSFAIFQTHLSVRCDLW